MSPLPERARPVARPPVACPVAVVAVPAVGAVLAVGAAVALVVVVRPAAAATAEVTARRLVHMRIVIPPGCSLGC